MTDQQRGVTIDPLSEKRAKTPRIDGFREHAVHYARGFAPAPHCSPSRASFFTGLYPSEHGVWNNVNVTNALSRGPREATSFWSSAFLTAGYTLAFTGKWHVSNTATPADLGWHQLHPEAAPGASVVTPSVDQQRSVARAKEIGALERKPISPAGPQRGDGQILRPGWPDYRLYGTAENPFGDEDVVEAGRRFIEQQSNAENPFVLYVGTLGPHDPYVPPERFLDMYPIDDIELPPSFFDPMSDKPALYRRTRRRFDQLTEDEHRTALQHYLAFCTYEDELFGSLLDALDNAGLADDTIVVYLSDHGDYAAEHGLWGKGLPAFLPAYHVPVVIRPHREARGSARRSDDAVTLLDIGPTLLELCDLAAPSEMSGRSLAADLRGEAPIGPRDVVFQSNGNEVYGIQRTIISGQWKLVVNLYDEDELYDLATDPDELRNLLAIDDDVRRVGVDPLGSIPPELCDVLERLYRRLWRHALRHDDEIINDYILTALATFGPMPVAEQADA
ncbi:sulfatase-like hydrolase/transferase [Microbacterium esteraromaticum]|nr:sulfatase-like hydrolase/transferase [Microbacterium esteraromaticum]